MEIEWQRISGVGGGRGGNKLYAVAAAKSVQSCPTVCDSIDGSPRPWDSPDKNTGVG